MTNLEKILTAGMASLLIFSCASAVTNPLAPPEQGTASNFSVSINSLPDYLNGAQIDVKKIVPFLLGWFWGRAVDFTKLISIPQLWRLWNYFRGDNSNNLSTFVNGIINIFKWFFEFIVKIFGILKPYL